MSFISFSILPLLCATVITPNLTLAKQYDPITCNLYPKPFHIPSTKKQQTHTIHSDPFNKRLPH